MNTLLAAPLALVLVATANGQNRPQPAPSTAPAAVATATRSEPFVLEAGTIQLVELVDRVAAYLDYNLLYSESELGAVPQNGIRLTRRTEVDRAGCWELFNSLLYQRGFAILTMDRERGFYEVIFMNGARAREIANAAMFVPHTEVDRYARLQATPILTSVPLQSINATIATNALRPFFAAAGPNAASLTLGNVGNSSDLLLQGFGPQVAAACRLLQLIDRGDDGTKPLIQVVVLEHAVATDIVARLQETLSRSQAEAMTTGMSTVAPLRAVPHPALNAIVLGGSAAQINDALELIARLDRPATGPKPPLDDVLQCLQQLEQRVQQLEQAQRSTK